MNTGDPDQSILRQRLRAELQPACLTPSRTGRAWRGNGTNVDINRNFAAGWGNDERSSADARSWNYRGQDAGSEAETKVLDAVMGRGGYHLVVDVHSAGERVIGYIPGPQGASQEEGGEADRWASYLMERRKLRMAGQPLPPHDPAYEAAMRDSYEKKGNQHIQAIIETPTATPAPTPTLCTHTSTLPR